MKRQTENKIVLVVRETRLEELKAKFNTVSQARFYVQQLGGNFEDYEQEDTVYQAAVQLARKQMGTLGRVQVVHRAFVPNFIFGPDDIAVAVGQDGLVANVLKYLHGQPLVGVNPDPKRYDGQLLPFAAKDLDKIIPEIFLRKRATKKVTMAKAALNNGQVIYAVNDIFVGPKSHGSARYILRHEKHTERHSSSGVIVSTGMGSTGWLTSLLTGARGITAASGTMEEREDTRSRPPSLPIQMPWDANHLCFTVREPFPTKTTGVSLVFGKIAADAPLVIQSLMSERGVIFSDGVEADFVEFNAGSQVSIAVADRHGILVV